jgi:hypothetical protein
VGRVVDELGPQAREATFERGARQQGIPRAGVPSDGRCDPLAPPSLVDIQGLLVAEGTPSVLELQSIVVRGLVGS